MSKEDLKDVDIFAPTLPSGGAGQSILIITDDKVHDLELFYPYYRFIEEGYRVVIASPKGGDIEGKAGYKLQGTRKVEDINPLSYDLLYIPGGKAPASLRKEDAVIEKVQQFASTGRPIAAFCHGPQVLISADLVRGKKLAAYPEVEEEILEAGGSFVNAPLVEDGQFITSRWPGDLPTHVKAILKRLKSAQSQPQKIAS